MPTLNVDAYGHAAASSPGELGTALASGAVSTTAVGTIAPTTAAGASPTVTAVSADDRCGKFTLSPVTGGGAQAAGEVVLVTFAQPYPAAPKNIHVSVFDDAGGSGSCIAAAPSSVTVNSFKVSVGAALTTAHTYTVRYTVFP